MRAVHALLLLTLAGSLTPAPAQSTSRTHKKTATPAVPADNDTEVEPLPILKITFDGNEHYPSDAILQAVGLKTGDTGTKAVFDGARQRIQDLGLFDKVSYEFHLESTPRRGYVASISVREITPLCKVQFAGFPAKAAELSAYLKSRDPLYNGSAPPTQPIIDRWARYLEAWAASKNQPKKIIGKLVSTATGEEIVQFQPDEPLPAVARVDFSGNDAIDTLTLQTAIGSVAYGLPYTEQNFRDFLDNQVRPLYEARGMLRVGFENITSEPVPPPVKGVLVHVKVVEGAVYKLGKISFAGVNADDKDNLAHVAGLKSGVVADFDDIGKSAEKVTRSVRRSGYLHVSTSVDRNVDDAAKKVNIVIKVDRGPKYEFGTMTIQGLDLNGVAAVAKQWGKQPGDPYNPDYPDHFLEVIKDEGLFDHFGPTHSVVKINDESHVANVTLVFSPEEKRPAKDKQKERIGSF